MSLTVKEAINLARVYLAELMPEIERPQEIRLEEVEQTTDANWAITLSIPGRNESVFNGSYPGPFGFNRIAKIVVVDAADGKFVALKQRAA